MGTSSSGKRELDALDSWWIAVADKSLWGLVSRPLVQPLWCPGVFVGVSEEVRVEAGTTHISVAHTPVRLSSGRVFTSTS